jgi:serine/threonine-protein kinase
MGVVYLARDPDLNRPVAVKVLLRPHEDNPDLMRRFLEEAQVGSQLQHPGVAPVHEAGRLEDGRPYFAMKLVQGRTLAELLRERPHPAHDRPRFLQIFEQVCQTLGYAHSRGVIHRDLKPANVMVGAFGEVQVMDWGFAKVVRDGAAAAPVSAVRTVRTAGPDGASQAGAVLGTPEYMAPEQAAGLVEELDARCDVFGLGAILCEVLTGRPPYAAERRWEVLLLAQRADLAEAHGRLTACGADAELVRLARACLAPKPADRPRDAAAVADAVQTYLAGVQERLRAAALDQAAARIKAIEERKQRRLTWALGAACLAVALGGGGWWAAATQEQATRREDQARTERDQAEARREQAERGARKAADVEAALREAEAKRAAARAAEADDPSAWAEALAAARRVEGLLADADLDDAARGPAEALVAEMGREAADRRLLARVDAARTQLAVGFQRGPFGPYDYEGAAALYAEAFAEAGMDVAALNPEEAAARVNRRTAIRDELLAALADWAFAVPDLALGKKLRAVVRAANPDPASFRRRWDAAETQRNRDALIELAHDPAAQNLPPAASEALARSLSDMRADAEALAVLREARRRRPDDFWINLNLANRLDHQKPPAREEAIRYYTAAAALRPRSAVTHASLAFALRKQGRADEAVEEYRAALAVNPHYALAHCGLGAALYESRQTDAAIEEFQQAVALDPKYGEAFFGLGVALAAKDRMDEAIRAYKKALAVYPNYAEAHFNLGLALNAQGKTDEAADEFQKAVELEPADAESWYSLGNARNAQRRTEDAMAAYRQAVAADPKHVKAHNNLGNLLYGAGRNDEAVAEFRKAIEADPKHAVAHFNLGNVYTDQGRIDQAIKAYREAVAIDPAVAASPLYARAQFKFGNALMDRGRADEAAEAYRKVTAARPTFAEAHCNRGKALEVLGRFAEARAELRRGHELGSKNPNWAYPTEEWIAEADELFERERLLPAVLGGAAEPCDAEGRAAFGLVCTYTRRHAAAARLWADAFAEEPELKGESSVAARFHAARSAAAAGSGKGEGAAALSDADRAGWRRKALEWLREDVAARRARMAGAGADRRAAVRQALRALQTDPVLACVRDADALAGLPEKEKAEWKQLWTDVDAAVKEADRPE